VSTIKTDRRRPSCTGRFLPAAVGLLAGCALTFMAVPILAGAAAALPGDPAARALRHRADISDEAALTLVTTRTRALERYDALEWRRELATVSVMSRDGRAASAQAIDRGLDQTRAALRMAPASPQDWLRLALLESMSGDDAKAVSHLSTALLTGADMPRLRSGVVDLAFSLWTALPTETRAATLTVLRHAWQVGDSDDRHALLTRIRDRGFLPLAVLALSQEDGLQEELAKI
jgi:hypothetical protein